MDKKASALGRGFAVVLAGAAGFGLQSASATLVQVSSRAALNADVAVSWGAFGPSGTSLQCFCSTPVGPLTVGINGTSGLLDRADEGANYTGNFAVGNALLVQPFISDELFVSFTSPVSATGTQIQPLGSSTGTAPFSGLIGSFTGNVRVFTNDGMDAQFSVAGTSTLAEDNSAPFIGVVSTTNDIVGLGFFANTGNPSFPSAGNLAINELDVRIPAVPEPASALLLIPAVWTALLVGAARRARDRPALT